MFEVCLHSVIHSINQLFSASIIYVTPNIRLKRIIVRHRRKESDKQHQQEEKVEKKAIKCWQRAGQSALRAEDKMC